MYYLRSSVMTLNGEVREVVDTAKHTGACKINNV